MTKFHEIDREQHHIEKGGFMPAEVSWEFLNRIPGGVFRYSADDNETIDYFSQDILEMFGCTDEDQFREHVGNSFKGMVHPDELERVEASIYAQIEDSTRDTVTYRLNRIDGADYWVEDWGHYVVDSDGHAWFYVTIIDITEKIAIQRELERANERQEILTALCNDIVFDINCATGEADVFGDAESRFGRGIHQEDLIVRRGCEKDCRLNIVEHPTSWLVENASEDSIVDRELSVEGDGGEAIWYRYQSVVLHDETGMPVRHVGRLLDTNEQAQRESAFRRKAERDGLTGVYNRNAAIDRIEAILRTTHLPCTYIIVDVDDFKSVNDTFGHPEGDRVLKELAQFLENTMRKEDVVARLGGDEFVIFAQGLGRGPALDRVLEHLGRGPFAEQRQQDAAEVAAPTHAHPSISVGAVCCMEPPVTYEELYNAADALLYNSKDAGKAQYSLTYI